VGVVQVEGVVTTEVETAVFSRYDSSKPPQNGCHPTRGEVTTEQKWVWSK
jgi:hypothetical protein